jgi:hypothetical protein
MLVPAQPLTISIDGATLRAGPASPVSFSRVNGRWRTGAYRPAANEKRNGAEGPIFAAISDRQIYVYGTADAPSPEELLRRKQEAATAAAWSTQRSPLVLTFRVVADAEIKEADLKSSNLILFGTEENNTQIAALARRLPVHLNPGAADYGLVFVIPSGAPNRYAVVNSGLPWWTRADQAVLPGDWFIPLPYRLFQSVGDFIFFKGGLDGMLASGTFDRAWRIPAAAKEKMLATGAIALR